MGGAVAVISPQSANGTTEIPRVNVSDRLLRFCIDEGLKLRPKRPDLVQCPVRSVVTLYVT